MLSQNQLSMPYLRLFIGVVLIALSLYATVAFLSQGFDGLTFLSIVVFALCIEAVKVLFSGDIGFYLALKQPEKALFAFSVVAVLFILSIGSETWLLTSGALKNSAQLESVTGKMNSLQNQIADKKAQLALCHPSHLTKCVNPRTQELQALQAEFDNLQSASVAQTSALANQKFWQQLASATGSNVENLQLGLNLLRSALAEIIGLFCIAQFSTFKRLQKADLSAVYSVSTENHSQNDNAALLAEIERLKAINAQQQKQLEQDSATKKDSAH
jgi:hypothetical protein